MQPLRTEDVFTGVDTGVFQSLLDQQPSESCFDTFRGFLLACVLGLPLWALLILAGYWLWF